MAIDAIKVNHKHHQEYGGYSGSDIEDMNESAICILESVRVTSK